MMQTSKFIKALFLVAGIVLLVLFNYFLLEDLIIQDPCAYHGENPSFIFNLFYDTSSSAANGHPIPTVINFAGTVFIGYFLGKISYKKWNNRQQTRVN
jgi:hypothetical protein